MLVITIGLVLFLSRWWEQFPEIWPNLIGWLSIHDQSGLPLLAQFGTHLLTVVVIIMTTLGMGVAGQAVARWTSAPGSGLSSLIVGIALGLTGLSSFMLGLGLTGLAFRHLAVIIVCSLVILGFRVLPRIRPPAAAWPLTLGVLFSLPAALVPEQDVDSLIYHLALPSDYANVHKICIIPRSAFSGYWQGQEMLHLPALLLGSETGAKLVSWMAAILLALCAVSLTRPWLPKSVRWLTGAVLLVSPPLFIAATRSKNDALAALLVGAGLLARAHGPNRSAWALTAGLLIGAASACKNTAVIALPALMATYLFVQPGHRLRNCVLAIVGAALPVLPWLVRNGLELGNPVFPLLMKWIPTLGMTQLDGELMSAHVFTWQMKPPSNMVEAVVATARIFGGFNLISAVGLVMALAARKRLGHVLWLVIFVVVFGIAWLISLAWVARFALPVALPLTVLGMACFTRGGITNASTTRTKTLESNSTGSPPMRLNLPFLGWAGLLAGGAMSLGVGAWSAHPLSCALGWESRVHFSQRVRGSYWDAAQHIMVEVAPDRRALVVGDWRRYPSTSRLFARWIANAPTVWEIAHTSDSVERIKTKLRQLRVTHVLYNLPQANFWAEYAEHFPWQTDALARYKRFWNDSATLVWRSSKLDPIHGYFLLFRLSRNKAEQPFRVWLPGTEGEFSRLRMLCSTVISDRRVDEELERLGNLFGDQAEFYARRGGVRAFQGQNAEALKDFRAASRAAPEAKKFYLMFSGVMTFDASERQPERRLQEFMQNRTRVAATLFTLGVPFVVTKPDASLGWRNTYPASAAAYPPRETFKGDRG